MSYADTQAVRCENRCGTEPNAGDKIRVKHITWEFEDGDFIEEQDIVLTVRSVRNRYSDGRLEEELFVSFLDMEPRPPHTAVVQLHHIDEWEVVG